MKRSYLRLIFALAAIAAMPAVVRAQATPAPASSTTPDPGLYKIPPTTPVGMPAYSISPSTTSPAAETPTSSRPVTASDCAKGGWRTYSALNFKTESACRVWLKKHPAGGASGAPTPAKKSPRAATRKTTPRVRITVPPVETTPGSLITPLLYPTPASR